MNDSRKLKLVCSAMLQSWRIQGLGPRDRYTELHPTKSGIIGMIACALGYEREDPRIQQLFNKTELYFDQIKSGSLICNTENETAISGQSIDTLIDFQVARAPKVGMQTADGKKRIVEATLIYKEYIVNHSFVLYLVSDDSTLKTIEEALKNPVWQYYLGSKCCIPAEPVGQGISDVRGGELNDYQHIRI